MGIVKNQNSGSASRTHELIPGLFELIQLVSFGTALSLNIGSFSILMLKKSKNQSDLTQHKLIKLQ